MVRIGWKRGILWAGLGVVLVFLISVCVLFYRPFRADWVLDGEVLAVAMDWRDFGHKKAQERLEWTMQRRGLDRTMTAEDCVLEEKASGVRVVKCVWDTEVFLPFTGFAIPLEFSSIAVVDLDGEINGNAL